MVQAEVSTRARGSQPLHFLEGQQRNNPRLLTTGARRRITAYAEAGVRVTGFSKIVIIIRSRVHRFTNKRA